MTASLFSKKQTDEAFFRILMQIPHDVIRKYVDENVRMRILK